MSIDIRISDNSKLFAEASQEALKIAAEAIGLEVEKNAKQLAPFDTGRLRNSITHTVVSKPNGAAAVVGSAVEYAPFVELGTRKSKAQPFLRPAVENHADEYRAIAESVLKGGGTS